MNRFPVPRPRRVFAAASVVALGLACAAAQAQTWEYKLYKKSRTGQFHKDDFTTGTIALEEKDGKAFFSMNSGRVDACLRGQIPAVVTKTEATTTIELQQPIAGCEAIRYVIRNDGSGGDREVRQGDRWAKDAWDHGLTPAK